MACPLCTACARCSAVDLPCHPAPTERAPAPVRHLHVPKTGTSFAYTLVAHRCGGVLRRRTSPTSRDAVAAYDLERALIDRARAASAVLARACAEDGCAAALWPHAGEAARQRDARRLFRRPAQSAFYHEKHAVDAAARAPRSDIRRAQCVGVGAVGLPDQDADRIPLRRRRVTDTVCYARFAFVGLTGAPIDLPVPRCGAIGAAVGNGIRQRQPCARRSWRSDARRGAARRVRRPRRRGGVRRGARTLRGARAPRPRRPRRQFTRPRHRWERRVQKAEASDKIGS